jgi:phosphoglycerate dehydrogenase-like enzyme
VVSARRTRVAVLDDYEGIAATTTGYERLTERAEVTIFREPFDSPEAVIQALANYEILLLMRERTRFSEDLYRALPELRLISQTGRTSGHLDLPAATRRGISVTGTPADNGAATKELTIGLLLALLRKIPEVDHRMRQERWPALAGTILEGKTVGVLGMGRIGTEVARILHVFNTRVLAYSPSLTPERAGAVGAECVPMDRLLRESDIVTLHVQSNAQTRGLIGARELGLMKRGAFLINTARAALVDQAAMIQAL